MLSERDLCMIQFVSFSSEPSEHIKIQRGFSVIKTNYTSILHHNETWYIEWFCFLYSTDVRNSTVCHTIKCSICVTKIITRNDYLCSMCSEDLTTGRWVNRNRQTEQIEPIICWILQQKTSSVKMFPHHNCPVRVMLSFANVLMCSVNGFSSLQKKISKTKISNSQWPIFDFYQTYKGHHGLSAAGQTRKINLTSHARESS